MFTVKRKIELLVGWRKLIIFIVILFLEYIQEISFSVESLVSAWVKAVEMSTCYALC